MNAMNCCVVAGSVSADVEIRVLESGAILASLSVTCDGPDGRRTSVPVSIADPPTWIATVEPGDELVVFGRVRRRFFQTGGGTGSRVELVAESAARSTQRRRCEGLVRRAVARLDDWDQAPR